MIRNTTDAQQDPAPAFLPRPGDRIRATRRAHGKVRFIKTGLIDEVFLPYGYRFKEDGGGTRFLAACERVADQPGWSQTIEPI